MPELIEAVQQAVAAGEAPAADVRLALAQSTDTDLLAAAGRALAGLRDPGGELRPVRLLLLADCPAGPFPDLLRAVLVAAGARPEPAEPTERAESAESPAGRFDAGFDAGLAEAGAELVVGLVDERYFLPDRFDLTDPAPLGPHLADRLDRLAGLAEAALAGGTGTLVLHTVPLPRRLRDTVVGLRARGGLTRHWQRLNAGLLDLAEADGRIEVIDLAGLLATAPTAARSGATGWTDAALLLLAQEVRRVAQTRLGLSRRLLALGPEASHWPVELGRCVKRLAEQGIHLVPTDHHTPDPVERVLSERPEVLINAAAFSRRVVNWAPKAGNLRRSAESLGLGADALVFLTESDFERGHVAAELPEVAVVDSGGDPARLVDELLGHGWFDLL
ncbi:hypothetical protein P3T35_002504 [Kitasatospora sp. GP30]|uniref:hypothetical protein n=1 Tax=Kitasatospora sp. GP30 TaxID=3035084 RepID=UPI000CB2797B|nr:hypothetical protein [Kitasatospora sp. GP30]MDH6140496.1 hypothetical protein [Kitasatospora sp. GP30]